MFAHFRARLEFHIERAAVIVFVLILTLMCFILYRWWVLEFEWLNAAYQRSSPQYIDLALWLIPAPMMIFLALDDVAQLAKTILADIRAREYIRIKR